MAVREKDKTIFGENMITSHIDSPRLDLKQNPIYEDLNLNLIKTHYYGDICKYQWLSIPLFLHETIVDKNGKELDITIGENPGDSVFTVPDLLLHLAGKLQNNKKLSDVFDGEKLNLLAGSIPLGDKDTKKRFKLDLSHLLYEKYGIRGEDFISAGIEAAPVEKARDIGIDWSMIGSYGQNNRACAYTSLKAFLAVQKSKKIAVVFFFDKEEIGSEGNSGAKSSFIKDFVSDLLFINGENTDNRSLRKSLINSSCLSADVNAAIDPDYKDVHGKLNPPDSDQKYAWQNL
jgi:aspartyl aminopeptidase